MSTFDEVGPVLEAGEVAEALVRAIKAENASVSVVDRGSYLRVLVPRRCTVSRAGIERELGRAFHLPGDLEMVMPSFKGKITLSFEAASWSAGGDP